MDEWFGVVVCFIVKKKFDIYGVENIVLGFVIIRFFVGNDK